MSTSSIHGGDLSLRSKTCPIAAGRRFFYSVVVFYYHGSTMGCFRRYIRFVGAKLYLVPALWDAFDVTLICFRRSKAIQCLLVRAPFENQFPVWMVMLVGCMSLFMVGVDRWLSAFLYSLAWSTNVSFFRLYHPRLVSFCCFWEGWFCEGDFYRPRALTALEIGTNGDVSLEIWSWPLLCRWLCVSVDVAS